MPDNVEIWYAAKQKKYKSIVDKLYGIIGDAQYDANSAIVSMLEVVCDASHSEAGTFWFCDRSTDSLIRARAVYGGADLSHVKLKLGQGIAGKVILTSKPEIVGDVKLDKNWFADNDFETKFKTESMICVPVTVRHNTFGCIQLLNKTDGTYYDEKDLELAIYLANEIAKICAKYNILVEEREYDTVAVLYAGITNLEKESSRVSPEVLRNALRDLYEVIQGPIFDNGGVVDNTCNEGLLAYWIYDREEAKKELAEKDEDTAIVTRTRINPTAARICQAAMGINAKKADLDEAMKKYGLIIDVSIGAAFGPAYLGNAGSSIVTNNTIVGHTVSLAKKLQEATKPWNTTIDSELAYLIQNQAKLSKGIGSKGYSIKTIKWETV